MGELTSAHCGAQIWWLKDDRHLFRLVEAWLRACGWRLTLFHKSQDLLDAFHQDQPDLLILDRLLPGLNGEFHREPLPRCAPLSGRREHRSRGRDRLPLRGASLGSDQKSLASILLLGMGLSLVALQTLLHDQTAPLTQLVLLVEGLSCDLERLRLGHDCVLS